MLLGPIQAFLHRGWCEFRLLRRPPSVEFHRDKPSSHSFLTDEDSCIFQLLRDGLRGRESVSQTDIRKGTLGSRGEGTLLAALSASFGQDAHTSENFFLQHTNRALGNADFPADFAV